MFTHVPAEATEATPLCRCAAGAEALTTLGFPVEVRDQWGGIAVAGEPAHRARAAATRAGLVTMLCHCGRTRAQQEAHRAWIAAGAPRRVTFCTEAVHELVALGAITPEHAASVLALAAPAA